ncbi:AcrR family transcriptional regulator [Nocardioides sp. BE266]|uniref:TetR/AcrR family transcriptional regulator n=1 Tax=Nocardioides sp. BE266 TaxID=2817725 RepID=UPI002858848B|nr:helix-turn-helix domain-containing protein [Nocardioides sp. BE266]MDR7254667.1 AcrR family transcriptional regulator [Nocardioides sp. BE266]
MDRTVKSRSYDATRRRAAAEENRRRILRAAHELFLEHGYARTSLATVASTAGVSNDLVYKAFGNKRQLVIEVMNFAVTGEVDSPKVLDQAGPQAVRAETDQRRQVEMFAADIAGRISRVRPVDDVIRSAAAVDPELAERRASMQQTRLANLRAFVEWLAANGPLRDGLTIDDATATVWSLAGPDMHRLMVDDLGWDHEHYRSWLHGTLEAALLPPR